jgi:NAD(P)-dependent dehydrogenase (short-subunit alcohol dehydrogenase family)
MADKTMAGKVILITGGTDGIGKQAAKELAEMGAEVVVVGRSEAKCQATIDEIKAFSGNDQVEYLLADLSSMAQVKALADAFRQKYTRLDVLVNNAGAGFVRRQESADGYEMTFALNHLAYYLLTRLLLDMLTASAPSRVVNTSSNSHFRGRINFEDLMLKRGYSVMKGYSQSKLANVLFTFELSRRLAGTGVTANCVHPGLVDTGIFRKRPFGWLIAPFITMGAIPVEEGAETIVYLASSAEAAQVSGEYFYKKKVGKTAELAKIESDQKRLWEVSEELVQKWL